VRSSRGTVPRHIPSLLTAARESHESVCANVRPGGFWLLFFGAALLLALSGCAKKSLSKSELHAITGEIVSSAQKITGHKSEITIRPQADRSIAGVPTQSAADDVYISLSDPSQTGPLEDALADVARRHNLRVVATTSGGVIRFDFISNGTRTHTVHIVAPIASQPRAPVSHAGGNGSLAIILDDLGYDRAAAESLLALPFPLTVSVIPHLPLSSEVAEEAYRRGDQVLLHLPMESESQDVKQESVELRVGMNSQQVESALAGMLATVPHAAGVNNHQGSRATADSALMQELMPALRERRLFFIDSRTTTGTVAYDVAERSGVPAASRKVFLDDNPAKKAIEAQLNLAARDAVRDGSAIAIGHPHPATITALSEMLPQLEARGVRLVFASDVVR
jgi:polysaccharide deacetylase 2 family uncharacterized protein YibQ